MKGQESPTLSFPPESKYLGLEIQWLDKAPLATTGKKYNYDGM